MSTSSEGAAIAVADATGADTGPDADTAGGVRTQWRHWLLRGGAAVLALALLAGAAWAGRLLVTEHRRDSAATEALGVARDFAVTLTTADPGTVDDKVRAVIDGSTGEFRDRYTKSSAQLRKLLIDNEVATRGTVVDGAVKSAEPTRVEVLLVVKQTVSNSAVPEEGTDLVPVAMTMEEVDGRWLASEVVVFGEDR
ncbi:hypothetical protein [Mycobacterium sp. 1274756.6]|uniref:hypothetical protein n=1 Tax=Mycobacterium sp. 1274756.6 TaxID=1834076 RepID=UPI0008021253|nr:hypothetical protein [Mycobacterium sp. 1274756.6]OBJ69435.1 hypothetical protein A5643_12085 [Mycobacterium sp. 1274756.6]